jgi:hypothetical protein
VVELAGKEESVDACFELGNFVETAKMGRPGMLEAAEIDRRPRWRGAESLASCRAGRDRCGGLVA